MRDDQEPLQSLLPKKRGDILLRTYLSLFPSHIMETTHGHTKVYAEGDATGRIVHAWWHPDATQASNMAWSKEKNPGSIDVNGPQEAFFAVRHVAPETTVSDFSSRFNTRVGDLCKYPGHERSSGGTEFVCTASKPTANVETQSRQIA